MLAACFPFIVPAWRLSFVVAAGLTDWMDGWLARRLDVRSTSGRLLDAVADKLFVFAVLMVLVTDTQIDLWQAGLVLSRDLVVGGVAAYAALTHQWDAFRRMVPRVPGKIATALQFGWFIALLVPLDAAVVPLFVLTAGASVVVAGDYLDQFARAMRARR